MPFLDSERERPPQLTGRSVSFNLRSLVTYQEDALTALGDRTRRAIFEALADGPRPVGELAAGLPVSRPAVSQHLRVLKDAGLVRVTAAGTRRLYQLDPDGISAARAYFEPFWNRALASFKDVVEQRERNEP
jgi:DNA-binding transcriptional ArsR family regulator